MKRTLIVVLMVLVCIGTIFAAGQKETKPVIYGIYKAGDQTWFIDEGKAAQAAAESAGYSFTYVDAKMSPEEYLRAIDNAIANNAAGIVTCIPDQTMSKAVVISSLKPRFPWLLLMMHCRLQMAPSLLLG